MGLSIDRDAVGLPPSRSGKYCAAVLSPISLKPACHRYPSIRFAEDALHGLITLLETNSLCAIKMKNLLRMTSVRTTPIFFFLRCTLFCFLCACAPRVVQMSPLEGAPGSVVSLSMEYLVGWPRVEIGDRMMDWPQLKLIASKPERKNVPGEELVWIEDKILQFTIPDLPPGDYQVTIHDDKGPPGDAIYSVLETTAYLAFPPVWPFVIRSNSTVVTLRVLPVK